MLRSHVRARDVRARLVEFDRDLAHDARNNALVAGLEHVEVMTTDAGDTDAYTGAVPANIALFCGVFGNITNEDIQRTISLLPSLLASGAEVLWTRHTMDPDLTPAIRGWFETAGFEEMAFVASETRFAVGTHRLTTTPASFEAGVTLFEFVGR